MRCRKISGGNNQLPLTISADANAKHQFVVTAMDVAGRLGFHADQYRHG